MKKILSILGIVFILMLSITMVMAAEEGEEEEPAWFPLLEVAGVIIGLVASVYTFKNYKAMKGGAIGESFKFILGALIIITLGIALRGLNEQFGMTSEIIAEIINDE